MSLHYRLCRNRQFFRNLCTHTIKDTTKQISHVPVMADEVLQYLKPEKGNTILDMTFGAGGHSKKILDSVPSIKLLALDRDPTAHNYASELAVKYPSQVTPLLGKFSDLPELLKHNGFRKNSIDGILFDFGCSSMQFDSADRGFAISKNAPLDMRMDADRNPEAPTAADILANASEEDLYKVIKIYGEEKHAKKIARAIVESRYLFKKLTTTEELAGLVEAVCTSDFRLDKLQRRSHIATKTFQALRIFVNNELNEINYGMILAHHYLKLGGRLVAISFHSLEDTIVKRHLLGNVFENCINSLPLKYCSHTLNIDNEIVEKLMESNWLPLSKHVISPTEEEVEVNPRSRSAKLRAAIKVN